MFHRIFVRADGGAHEATHDVGCFGDRVGVRGKPIALSDYVKYYGEDGKTAFDLLVEQKVGDQTIDVQSKKYDFGVFIESINGTKPDDKHFWKLYINGQEAQVGADQLQTKKGDIIEWTIAEITK